MIGESTHSDVISATGDYIGTHVTPIDPKLGVLAYNGGTTKTMTLLKDSLAIGKGDCTGNPTVHPPAPIVSTDQRGVTRWNPCSIGAYDGSVASNTY